MSGQDLPWRPITTLHGSANLISNSHFHLRTREDVTSGVTAAKQDAASSDKHHPMNPGDTVEAAKWGVNRSTFKGHAGPGVESKYFHDVRQRKNSTDIMDNPSPDISQTVLQSVIKCQGSESLHQGRSQNTHRGTCQWSQALLSSASSINHSSSSHSSEKFQIVSSPTSDTPVWDGVSVWIPNTSISSRLSRASSASKSPGQSRQPSSVTPRSARFKTDVCAASPDSSNENIDLTDSRASRRVGQKIPPKSKTHTDKYASETFKASRNTSLKSTPTFTMPRSKHDFSEQFSQEFNKLHLKGNTLQRLHYADDKKTVDRRQQIKKHNSLQESQQSQLEGNVGVNRNRNNEPRQKQRSNLREEFLRPLEVLRKKVEMLDEQERQSTPQSDSEDGSGMYVLGGCQEGGSQKGSMSSFLSFEETLDRALEDPESIADNEVFQLNQFLDNPGGVLENIAIPASSLPVGAGRRLNNLQHAKQNSKKVDCNKLYGVRNSNEVFSNPPVSKRSAYRDDQDYSFVPNGQFLRLIEERGPLGGCGEHGVTQVVASNQNKGENLNYFLRLQTPNKLKSNEKRASEHQHTVNEQLLNLQGLLADIKNTIADSQVRPYLPRAEPDTLGSVPTDRTGDSDPKNKTSGENKFPNRSKLSNFPAEIFGESAAPGQTKHEPRRPLDDSCRHSNESAGTNSSNENQLTALPRTDSYRKLSPEKIKEISDWAEKTLAGFRGGNGRTDEIRVKDLLFKNQNRYIRHRKNKQNKISKLDYQDFTFLAAYPTAPDLTKFTPAGGGRSQLSVPVGGDKENNDKTFKSYSVPSKQSSSEEVVQRASLSSTETSFESSREARIEAIEAALDEIFDEFLERTLLARTPYIDDVSSPPVNEPLSASSSSLPVLFTTTPDNGPAVSSLSASNITQQVRMQSAPLVTCDSKSLDTNVNSSLPCHLKTSSDNNLPSCNNNNSIGRRSFSPPQQQQQQQHLPEPQQQQKIKSKQQQQQQHEDKSIPSLDSQLYLMAFRDELLLLRERLMERINCLECEHARKTRRLEGERALLERLVSDAFGLRKYPCNESTTTTTTTTKEATTTPSTESVSRKYFAGKGLTSIKKVIMTCDCKDGEEEEDEEEEEEEEEGVVEGNVRSLRNPTQTFNADGRKETAIDGSESENGELAGYRRRHRHHNQQQQQQPRPRDRRRRRRRHFSTGGGDDDDDDPGEEEEEIYVIVLKDGITIEGIHATVPDGINVPIKVQQLDLKENFEAAFRALNDVTDPPSWNRHLGSASEQRDQWRSEEGSRRSLSQETSLERLSNDPSTEHKLHQQQPLQRPIQSFQPDIHSQPQFSITTRHVLRPQLPLSCPQQPTTKDSIFYYHNHHQTAYNKLQQENLQSAFQLQRQQQQLQEHQRLQQQQQLQEQQRLKQQQQQHSSFRQQETRQHCQTSSQQLHQKQSVYQETTSQRSTHDNFPRPPESWMSREHASDTEKPDQSRK